MIEEERLRIIIETVNNSQAGLRAAEADIRRLQRVLAELNRDLQRGTGAGMAFHEAMAFGARRSTSAIAQLAVAFKGLVSAVAQATTGILRAFLALPRAIMSTFTGAFRGIGGMLRGVFNVVFAPFKPIIHGIGSVLGNGLGLAIVGALGAALWKHKAPLMAQFGSLLGGLGRQFASNPAKALGGFWNTIAGAIANPGNTLNNAMTRGFGIFRGLLSAHWKSIAKFGIGYALPAAYIPANPLQYASRGLSAMFQTGRMGQFLDARKRIRSGENPVKVGQDLMQSMNDAIIRVGVAGTINRVIGGAFGAVQRVVFGFGRTVFGVFSRIIAMAAKVASTILGVLMRAFMALGRVGMGVLIGALGALGVSLAMLAKRGIDVNLSMQMASTGLTIMLKSGERTAKMLQDLRKEARTSTFELVDMVQMARKFVAVGFSPSEALPLMRTIQDAAVGLALTPAEKKGYAERIGSVFQTSRAQNKFTGGEALSLMSMGINVREAFGLSAGTQIGEVEMPYRVSEAMLINYMRSKFGGMQEKSASTIAGNLSNVQDALNEIASTVTGDILNGDKGLFKSIETGARNLLRFLDSLEESAEGATILAGIKEIFDLIGDAIVNVTEKLPMLAKWLAGITKSDAFQSLKSAFANTFTYILALVIGVLDWIVKHWDSIWTTIKRITWTLFLVVGAVMSGVVNFFKNLFKAQEDGRTGMQKLADAFKHWGATAIRILANVTAAFLAFKALEWGIQGAVELAAGNKVKGVAHLVGAGIATAGATAVGVLGAKKAGDLERYNTDHIFGAAASSGEGLRRFVDQRAGANGWDASFFQGAQGFLNRARGGFWSAMGMDGIPQQMAQMTGSVGGASDALETAKAAIEGMTEATNENRKAQEAAVSTASKLPDIFKTLSGAAGIGPALTGAGGSFIPGTSLPGLSTSAGIPSAVLGAFVGQKTSVDPQARTMAQAWQGLLKTQSEAMPGNEEAYTRSSMLAGQLGMAAIMENIKVFTEDDIAKNPKQVMDLYKDYWEMYKTYIDAQRKLVEIPLERSEALASVVKEQRGMLQDRPEEEARTEEIGLIRRQLLPQLKAKVPLIEAKLKIARSPQEQYQAQKELVEAHREIQKTELDVRNLLIELTENKGKEVRAQIDQIRDTIEVLDMTSPGNPLASAGTKLNELIPALERQLANLRERLSLAKTRYEREEIAAQIKGVQKDILKARLEVRDAQINWFNERTGEIDAWMEYVEATADLFPGSKAFVMREAGVPMLRQKLALLQKSLGQQKTAKDYISVLTQIRQVQNQIRKYTYGQENQAMEEGFLKQMMQQVRLFSVSGWQMHGGEGSDFYDFSKGYGMLAQRGKGAHDKDLYGRWAHSSYAVLQGMMQPDQRNPQGWRTAAAEIQRRAREMQTGVSGMPGLSSFKDVLGKVSDANRKWYDEQLQASFGQEAGKTPVEAFTSQVNKATPALITFTNALRGATTVVSGKGGTNTPVAPVSPVVGAPSALGGGASNGAWQVSPSGRYVYYGAAQQVAAQQKWQAAQRAAQQAALARNAIAQQQAWRNQNAAQYAQYGERRLITGGMGAENGGWTMSGTRGATSQQITAAWQNFHQAKSAAEKARKWMLEEPEYKRTWYGRRVANPVREQRAEEYRAAWNRYREAYATAIRTQQAGNRVYFNFRGNLPKEGPSLARQWATGQFQHPAMQQIYNHTNALRQGGSYVAPQVQKQAMAAQMQGMAGTAGHGGATPATVQGGTIQLPMQQARFVGMQGNNLVFNVSFVVTPQQMGFNVGSYFPHRR